LSHCLLVPVFLTGAESLRVGGGIAITKDVYGHLLEGDKRAAAESMSRALFGG
jgi:hypothetical protein